MKINNPTKFFTGSSDTDKYNATLVARGDIITKFAAADIDENGWHSTKDENDSWVKYSFDGGNTWPLKFKYKNNLILKKTIPHTEGNDVVSTYTFDNSDEYASSKNGRVSFYAITEDDAYTTIPFFRYKFNDLDKTLSISSLMALPSDTNRKMAMIELNPDSIMGVSVPTFVDVSYIDISNPIMLGSENLSAVVPGGNIENISKMYLKISSADDNRTGNVMLKFTFGESASVTDIVSVDGEDTWKEINLNGQKSGELTIERLCDNDADTLKENDLVITCTISNIKVVMYS